jgi:F0F1-type ATP synthase membrane subunit b/b'
VGDLALQIAEKVIRKNIASDDAQRALVDQYLSEVETKN